MKNPLLTDYHQRLEKTNLEVTALSGRTLLQIKMSHTSGTGSKSEVVGMMSKGGALLLIEALQEWVDTLENKD